jgi:lipopolysaccharide transport system permease protein
MNEVRYSAASSLRSPRLFLRDALADLRGAIGPARHLFLKRLRGRHRQSVLGYLWLLLPPLATTLVWAGLRAAGVLPVGSTAIPYPIYVLCGTMIWAAFTESLTCPTNDLRTAGDMLSKIRLPHEAVLLSGATTAAFHALVRSVPAVAAGLAFGIEPGWAVLLVPLGLLAVVALGLGIGLLLAPFGLLYHDVPRAVDLLLGFGFLVTPIVYPVPDVYPASLLARLNPLVPLLTTVRGWMTGAGPMPEPGFFPVAFLSMAVLAVAWLWYRVAAPHLQTRL